MLIPLRKPRPFSGARGQSLKELYSACLVRGLGIVTVKKTSGNEPRYNTEAVVAIKLNGDAVESIQNTLYNRLTIKQVFKLAKFNTDSGDVAPVRPTVEVKHPMTTKQVLEFLNGVHRCDFDETDITITHKGGSLYAIEAKEQSLGYIGSGDLTIGESKPTINCAGAPSTITIPVSMDPADEANPPELEFRIGDEIIFSGSIVGTGLPDALKARGIDIKMESADVPPNPQA